jgi:hypothetical protein
MLAVQFTARVHKNTIKLPRIYKDFSENTVQVILMKENKCASDISGFAGKIRLNKDPLSFQRNLRNEWR